MPAIVNAIVMSITVGFTAAILLGISFFIAFSATHMPELINMPNRDYWLNDDKRPKTIRLMCSVIEIIGIATMLLILLLQWELFRVNRTVPPEGLHAYLYYAIGIYLAVVLFACVRPLWLFRLPKETSETEPPTQE